MKKVIYSLAILFITSLSANAQHRNVEGAAEIQVTYRQTDLSQLSSSLNAAGYKGVSDNNIWINLAMSHVHKKWIFEDVIGFTPFSSSETNNTKTTFNQYQLAFRFGYDISTNADIKFYPYAGLNFSAGVLNIQDNNREQSVSNFNQELANTTASKTLFQDNFGIELGAGFDYFIKLKPKTMDCFTVQRSIPIGIRAGYYIHAYHSDWKLNEYKLNNGPDKNQGAVFVSLNIGLGYKLSR